MREPMSRSSILAIRHAIKRTGLQILSDEHIRDDPVQKHGCERGPQGSAALRPLYLADIVFPGLFVDRDVDLFGKCRHVVLILAVGIVANRDGMLLAPVFPIVSILIRLTALFI